MNCELPDVQAGFRKDRGTRDQIATSVGSSKMQENSRKTPISALLTMPKPLPVWITTNWKILQEMGIQDHLTCLLRNVYAGQEATVITGHGTVAETSTSRNQAPHLESWSTHVYYAGRPKGVNTLSSELQTKGLQSLYTWTGMIQYVFGFAGARAIAKSRIRVSEISSSS